ncbi:MAG TPA: GNAT family N-acetyltransferase [Gaiellaceae bacterium]|jgi:ribosomal protein S18 acetylase RimI-like enzyme
MNTRPATRDDYAAIASLFTAADEAILGHPITIDVSEVDGWLHGVSLETNTWLVEEDGKLVAASFAQNRDGLGIFAGSVLPEAEGRGYGSGLVELAMKRLAEEGSTRLHAWTNAGHERAAAIFRTRGFGEVRTFWDMGIDLDVEPPEPSVAIDVFREGEGPAFHAALEEAFEDHWEPHPEPFESWWARQIGRSNYDPSLWFVIRDGDEIAAVCRNEERESCGYVGALGVRRDWRGRGYGRALLLHTFREFRRRGQPRVTLGVDAANPTGATKLYESVGMRALREDVVWEKILRP